MNRYTVPTDLNIVILKRYNYEKKTTIYLLFIIHFFLEITLSYYFTFSLHNLKKKQ